MAGTPATVLAAVEEHAVADPDAIAVIAPGSAPIRYRELADAIAGTANDLTELGVRPADRVAVVTGNDAGTAVLVLSVLSAAVCAPVGGTWSGAEITAWLDAVRPAAIVLPADASGAARKAVAAHGTPVITASATKAAPLDISLTADTELGQHDPVAGDGEALLLRTSGTTAAGKLIRLTTANVLAGARASVSAYRLTPADRRLNVMPLHHVQGLVGSVITALCAGSSVVCLPVFDPAAMAGQLAEHAATWFSATPTMHRLLLDHPAVALPELRFVRCGSGALPPTLRAELEQRYGVPVVESFGMSEGHQIASTPLPPDQPRAGMAPTGSELGMLADGVVHTEPGSAGELVVRGPNIIPEQLNLDPGSSYVDGWLCTGDLGSLADDGSLLITGRRKEIVNCGGEKFSPHEVEDALLRHPGVREAVAFAVPDPVLVERAAAVIVPRTEPGPADAELTTFLGELLAPYKIPRPLIRRAEIPVAPSGKVSRAALPELFADELARQTEVEPSPNGRAPRNTTEAALAGLWALMLDRGSVGFDDDFLVLGGNSLTAVSLLSAVEEVFAVELEPIDLFDELTTVAAMADAIDARREG